MDIPSVELANGQESVHPEAMVRPKAKEYVFNPIDGAMESMIGITINREVEFEIN